MKSLPKHGDRNWGHKLNEWLLEAHNEDGTLKRHSVAVNIKDFAIPGEENDASAIMRAINSLPQTGGCVVIPPGTYRLGTSGGKSAEMLSDEHGDGAFSIFQAVAGVYLDERSYITIKAHGARFLCDEAGFLFYRCIDCSIEGGSFQFQVDTTSEAPYFNEPYAVAQIRSIGCHIREVFADRFHRNLVVYRCIGSGISRCRAQNSNYFNFFISSNIDVNLVADENAITAINARSRSFVRDCIAVKGRTANYFVDFGVCERNESYTIQDAERSTPKAICHILTLHGQCDIVGNYIFESAHMQDRSLGHGIIITNTGNNPPVQNVRVIDNQLFGCNTGIRIVGAHDVLVKHNMVKDWWTCGIQINSETGANQSLSNVIVANNIVGDINDDSKKTPTGHDKIAAIQCERNGSDLKNIEITNNICQVQDGQYFNLYTGFAQDSLAQGNVFEGQGQVTVSMDNRDTSFVYNSSYVDLSQMGTPAEPLLLVDTLIGARLFMNGGHFLMPVHRPGQHYELINSATSEVTLYRHPEAGNVFQLPDGTSVENSVTIRGPFRLLVQVTNELTGWIIAGSFGGIVTKS